MEKQSQNQGQRRRRRNRSGGGNQNRQRNRGGQNRRGNSNSRNRNRNRNRSQRRREPKPTAWQKFLSTVTFGLLGTPGKKSGKKKRVRKPDARTSRPVRNNELRDEVPGSEKKKRNRTEVTSGRLYVGNLSYETTEVELEDLFRGIGNVLSAEVVTNARTQQSKGFAFVEMGSIDEAERAVEVLDDEEFMGRKLIISGARSEGPRESQEDDSPAGKASPDETPEADSGKEAEQEEQELAEVSAEKNN